MSLVNNLEASTAQSADADATHIQLSDDWTGYLEDETAASLKPCKPAVWTLNIQIHTINILFLITY